MGTQLFPLLLKFVVPYLLPLLLADSLSGASCFKWSQPGVHKTIRLDTATVSRIIGGTQATSGQFPYQVAVRVTATGRFCGGSIISSKFILTTAHCFDKVNDGGGDDGGGDFDRTSVISLGVTNLQTDTGIRRTVPSSDIIRHERYNASSLENSIALMRLTPPIDFNEKIQPIRLPPGSPPISPAIGANNSEYENTIARLSGWGRTSNASSGVNSNWLRWIDVRVMSNVDCQDYYWNVYATTMCTDGAGRKGGCVGDGGGPLTFLARDGVRTQLGVAIFANVDDCQAGHPTGYVRVGPFLGWIRDKTAAFAHST